MKSDNQPQQHISFLILDCIINVHSDFSNLISILEKIYGDMQISNYDKSPDLVYKIFQGHLDQNQITISRDGVADLIATDI